MILFNAHFFASTPFFACSLSGVTTTPPHPKYQSNNITNTQMKMSDLTTNKLGRNGKTI